MGNGLGTDDGAYDRALYDLQVGLVRLQRHVIARGLKIAIVIEGRDGAGKDGSIKRIVEHLSPRETRVVALPKPSDRERSQWFFQRYIAHLPAAGEIVLFNRSWYNRAGVEPVMGFCSDEEYAEFLEQAPLFERMLWQSEITLLKYWLDIGRKEQKKRLAARRRDPLKQWKVSPIDAEAQARFDAYTEARDVMLARTDHEHGRWTIVKADAKKPARLALIRDILARIPHKGRDAALAPPDPALIIPYGTGLQDSVLAR